jgi:hypothetical protein
MSSSVVVCCRQCSITNVWIMLTANPNREHAPQRSNCFAKVSPPYSKGQSPFEYCGLRKSTTTTRELGTVRRRLFGVFVGERVPEWVWLDIRATAPHTESMQVLATIPVRLQAGPSKAEPTTTWNSGTAGGPVGVKRHNPCRNKHLNCSRACESSVLPWLSSGLESRGLREFPGPLETELH